MLAAVAPDPKAAKAYSAAKLDFWEGGYFFPGSKERWRRDAKKAAKKALRRSEAAAIEEGLASALSEWDAFEADVFGFDDLPC